jgi:hypothetical protein
MEVIEIVGDGNCFYRSLVRFLFNACPEDLQEDLSLIMRKLLNPLPKVGYQGRDGMEDEVGEVKGGAKERMGRREGRRTNGGKGGVGEQGSGMDRTKCRIYLLLLHFKWRASRTPRL